MPPQVLAEQFYKHVYHCCTKQRVLKIGQENDNYTPSNVLCGIILLNPRYQTYGGVLQVSGAGAGVGALTM